MPKFIATSGSYFEPFSYDQLVKPVAYKQEMHNAAQEAYNQLNMETNAIERYLSENPEEDIRAKELYNDYLDKLHILQNNLWENGFTAQTRRDIAVAKEGYSRDIVRLQKAITDRQARSDEYWKARQNNPNLVTGPDPGAASLDKYLEDDLYGKNWWSYDSTQFEKDMATETKARAQELLRGLTDPNGVVRNPRLAGQLTRVLSHGFTNGEVQQAEGVVDDVLDMNENERKKYYKHNDISPIVQLLSESLINRYDSTGVRNSNASFEEKMRLLGRGKAGLAAGIFEPEIKDFADPYFEQEMRHSDMKYKFGLEHPIPEANPEDTYIKGVDNTATTDFRDRIFSVLGSDNRVASASDLVYSGDLRRNAYLRFGFDIGRNPSKSPSGEVEVNGVIYETRFNPDAGLDDVAQKEFGEKKGAMQFKKKGSNDKFVSSNALTKDYYEARHEYLNRLNQYKNSNPEIYNLATIDPDKQYDLYGNEIPFSVSLHDAGDYVNERYPDNVVINRTWVARKSLDGGKYIGRISGLLMPNFSMDGDIAKENKSWSAYDGQTSGIHLIMNDGRLSNDAITNPNDVFTFKNGEITNIIDIQLDADSIMGSFGVKQNSSGRDGYLIATTSSGQEVAISFGLFNSSSLIASVEKAREKILSAEINPNLNEEERQKRIQMAIGEVSKKLKDQTGYDFSTQSQGGTSNNNNN